MEKSFFLVCLGAGYTARFVAARVLSEGGRVAGTSRSASGREFLETLGIEAFSPNGSDLREYCRQASHILLSAAPNSKEGDPFLHFLKNANPREFLPPAAQWWGYLSTTSVYGDWGGAWVDENSALRASTERGQLRIQAEKDWRQWSQTHALNLSIFRLAGIYGRERNALVSVLAGKSRRIVRPGQCFGRIHVEDAARVIHSAMKRHASGIYNLCDDLPAPPQNVIALACTLLERPLPPEENFEDIKHSLSPMARSFYSENKRVRNARLKRLANLRWPDYRSGLYGLWQALQQAPPPPRSDGENGARAE